VTDQQKLVWNSFIDKLQEIKSPKQKQLIAQVLEQLYGNPQAPSVFIRPEQALNTPNPNRVFEAFIRLRDDPPAPFAKLPTGLLKSTTKAVEEALTP
jgi:hypothetical protein